MTQKKRVLTGVKPTGLPHIGNYFGAIRPALDLAKSTESFLFIADYHALTTFSSAQELNQNTLHIAAAWLALGLDPANTVFYKQSDISEIFELNWILSCFASKGLLNRAHAYKALVDNNKSLKKDTDHNINSGIFNYPILMAADILIFNADLVPVGSDQKQHVEIARDIAETLNKASKANLTLPTPLISDSTKVVPGIDGRKMSKNYNNIIPIFLAEKQLRKRCMQIVTDSTPVEAPKDPDKCNVYSLLTLFLAESELNSLRSRYTSGGLGYGEIKQYLYEEILNYFSNAREQYSQLINNPDKLNAILSEGSHKAAEVASLTLKNVKQSLGLL